MERCLSEDPSPQTLEVHLPRIREIIIGLLQGLKAKQSEYKQYLVQSRASARLSKSRNERVGTSEELQQTTPTQSSEMEAFRRASSMSSSSNSQNQPTESTRRSILNQSGKRPTMAPPLGLTREPTSSESLSKSDRPPHSREDSISSQPSAENSDADNASSTQVRRSKKSITRRVSRNKVQDESATKENNAEERAIEEVARGEETTAGEDGATIVRHSLTDEGSQPNQEQEILSHALPASASYFTPSRREKNHMASSSLSQSAPRQGNYMMGDALNELGDAADPSVRALKSRDALERRASKRFSAYTFNKMGVGLNQGMGMSSYALSGVAGGGGVGSSNSSPLLERQTSSKLGGGSRRSGTRASVETLSENGRELYSNSSQRSHKGLILSSDDIMEESHSTESISETPSKQPPPSTLRKGSKTSPGQSPRGGNLMKLGLPPAGSHMSQAASSTDSLPFLDAEAVSSPQNNNMDLREELKMSPRHSNRDAVPPVPPLPSAEERARLSALQSNRSSSGTSRLMSTSPSTRNSNASLGLVGSAVATPLISAGSSSMTVTGKTLSNGGPSFISVFLQLGRQTRRATVEFDTSAPLNGLSIGKLRMLFMDKFSYSPGKEDFPFIYLKDAGSGVTYELEDLSDVGEGSVLTLNMEPLDQVKQHLDLSLSTITRELRELKVAVYEKDKDLTRRISATSFNNSANANTVTSPTTLKISDAQFAMAGARVAQFKQETMQVPTESRDVSSPGTPPIVPGSSDTSNWRGAGVQIKQQYDEVQKLRRSLAIINQIQGEFKSEVGGLIGALREQTGKVKNIAASEVPTERNFIIAGKARLDASSQEILTLVEDLLDAVDDLKADVIQRGVKPKAHMMKQMQGDIDRATKGLEDISTYVETVKPSWKKTWELELQNIVDEQEFLNHQEGLISDLKEDHYSLQDVFQNIQEVVKLRGANKFTLTAGANNGSDNFLGGVALRQYVPPNPEEGHGGLTTVMMEVKTQSVDHEKRLKALQAAERQRQKELSSRKTKDDGFQQELTTFVDGKILRKTGGYQETERVRTRRDKLTIQAMFSGGTNIIGGAPVEVNTSPPPKKLSLPPGEV